MLANNLELNYSFDGKCKVTITLTGKPSQDLQDLRGCEKPLEVSFKKYRKKRSLDSNAYLWVMLGEIANTLRADKWQIYLNMLKRYGKYTHIAVKPNVVEAMKSQWREIEEVGEVEVNGQKAVQLLCYFGSSGYDSKEFSILIDGVVSECKELGISTITPKELEQIMAHRDKKISSVKGENR